MTLPLNSINPNQEREWKPRARIPWSTASEGHPGYESPVEGPDSDAILPLIQNLRLSEDNLPINGKQQDGVEPKTQSEKVKLQAIFH